MMKKLITMLILLLLVVSGFSQRNKKYGIDSAKINCYYLFTKKLPGETVTFRTDTMLLQVGNRVTKFFDPARLSRDSLLAAVMPKDQDQIKEMVVDDFSLGTDLSKRPGTAASNTNEGESYQILKSIGSTKIRILDYINPLSGHTLVYEDEIGALPWKITGDTATIGALSCQKALLIFRGRAYSAWFAEEIPINDGPWKFSGLPGLIVKVEDQDSLFSFQLIGLMNHTGVVPIMWDESKSQKCTRAEFIKKSLARASSYQANFTDGKLSLVTDKSPNGSAILMELE